MITSTPYRQLPSKSRCLQLGMTLIEVLVALVIGSIAMIVILNLFATTEDRKRVTTSGADAAVNGQIAMTSIERDVRHAGLSMPGLTCPNIRIWVNGAVASFLNLPVRIDPDASNGGTTPATTTLAALQQQRLDIMYGNPADAFFNATLQGAMATSTAALRVDNGIGFRQGELVVISELGAAKDCSVVQMSADGVRLAVPNVTTTGTQWDLAHATGAATPFNSAANIFPAGGYIQGANARSFGNMTNISIGVAAGDTLQLTNRNIAPAAGSNPADLVKGVVALRARYGIDTSLPRDGVADSFGIVRPTSPDQLVAVRFAMITRGSHFERGYSAPPVTMFNGAETVTFTGTDAGYRYRVFETTVPLKNILWQ